MGLCDGGQAVHSVIAAQCERPLIKNNKIIRYRHTSVNCFVVIYAVLVGLTPGKTKCIMKAHS